jgi:hypothetical protein
MSFLHNFDIIIIYDIIHDINIFVMISYSILQKHTFPAILALPPYDFTHDNIAEIMKKGYDIKII